MTNPNKKVMISILGAAAVGAAAYILLGPGKNSDFKKKISDSVGDIACKLGEYFTGTKDKLQTAYSNNQVV